MTSHKHIKRSMQMHAARYYLTVILFLSTMVCVLSRGDFIQICRRRAFLLDGHLHKFGYLESFQNCSENCVLYLRGGANDTHNEDVNGNISPSNESIKRKPFLSFFRPRTSAPLSDARADTTSPIKKKIDPDKIPHGPTGGGYATMGFNSSVDISEETGDVLLMSDRNTEKKEASNLSYQSAFAINQGQTIKPMQELLSSKEEEKNKLQISKNQTNVNNIGNNITFATKNESEASEKSPTLTIYEATGTNAVKSYNDTSKIEETEFQTGNTSVVNVSASMPASSKDRPDYTSSGYVSY